ILRHDPSIDSQLMDGRAAPTVPRVEATRSLVAVASSPNDLEALVALAATLGSSQVARELILVQLVTGEGTTISEANADMVERRGSVVSQGIETRAVAFTSSVPARDIAKLAKREDVDLLLIVAPPELIEDGAIRDDTFAVLEEAPSDVALLIHRGDV